MAFRKRRYSSKNRTRLLEWTDNVELVMGANIAAGTQENKLLMLNSGLNPPIKTTIYRVVGSIAFRPNGNLETVFQYGLQRAVDDSRSSPSSQAEQDHWMWWGATVISTTTFQADRMINVPFDIKVKRILDTGDSLVFSVVGSTIYNTALNCRILSKITGS